jgi:hypothetical protein
MKGFVAFVDFASSTGNQRIQSTTLWFESTGVLSLGKNRLSGPAAIYFWGYFLFMANNGVFTIQFFLILWFCTGEITDATHVS